MRSRILAIAQLAYPIVIAQLGSILQGWADTIMVGQYGTAELSAAGFVNNVFNLIIYFLLGISYATTPVVGGYFSRGEYDSVTQARRSSVLVNFLVSLFAIALLWILYLNVERLGQPTELMPLIKPYFIVLLCSLPFLAVFNALKQCFDATGDTKTPMWVMLGGNIVNIILNYLLIFGALGLPELGLVGAGVATLLSRVGMMAAILLYQVKKGKMKNEKFATALVRQRLSNHRGSKFFTFHSSLLPFFKSFRDAPRLLRLGIPISLQMCLEAGSFNVCALFMGWIGSIALAAHQVMCTVSTIGFMVYYGIGAAAAIRIAYFRGQEEWDEVRKTATTALFMSFASAIVIVTLICVFCHPLASIFTTSDEVATLFIAMLPAFVCYQAGDCMQTIYANSLRAIEDVKYLLISAIIAYAIISVPLAYIFAFPCQWGATGVWWSFPFGLTTAGLIFLWRFKRCTNNKPLVPFM